MVRTALYQVLLERIGEKRRFIQVVAGPRQVGKTTVVRNVLEASDIPCHYASADEPTLKDSTWLHQQWDLARLRASESRFGAVLALDEIQKIPNWSAHVKQLWDEDTRSKTSLKVIVLGSAPLLSQTGLNESLAGHFEIISIPHWSFTEMHDAFGFSLEEYIFYGGYPGAASLIHDPERWRRYILDSLIETTISRDILLLTRVDKPALLRRLFYLGCTYSGQIVAYQKMLGQLTDAGNTTTLSHYLQLLNGAGMLGGLEKYSGGKIRQRASSPKFLIYNTALITAQDHRQLDEACKDGHYWGRLVENAVGAHLLNTTFGTNIKLSYWREGNLEVDFILQKGKTVVCLEVKSSARPDTLPGMQAFARQHKPTRQLLVGGQGVPLKEFLSLPASHWLQ